MASQSLSNISCNLNEPFVKLEENGKASILNYNLPQSTCYNASTFLGLDLDEKYFESPAPVRPDFWELTEKLTIEEIGGLIVDEMDFATSNPIFENPEVLQKYNVRQSELAESLTSLPESISADVDLKSITTIPVNEARIAGVSISVIAKKIKKGLDQF